LILADAAAIARSCSSGKPDLTMKAAGRPGRQQDQRQSCAQPTAHAGHALKRETPPPALALG